MVSGFIALTLTPMMCVKLLKHIDEAPGRLYNRAIEGGLNGLPNALRAPRCAGAVGPSLARAAWRSASRAAAVTASSSCRANSRRVEDRGVDHRHRHGARRRDARTTPNAMRAEIETLATSIRRSTRYLLIVGLPDGDAAHRLLPSLKAWDERHAQAAATSSRDDQPEAVAACRASTRCRSTRRRSARASGNAAGRVRAASRRSPMRRSSDTSTS